MAVLELTRQLLRMRRDWERRARENARHYVVTGQSQWTDEEFFRSGKITLEEEILNDLPNICQGSDPEADAGSRNRLRRRPRHPRVRGLFR